MDRMAEKTELMTNCKSSQNSVVSSQNKSGFELEFHSEFWILNSCKTWILQLALRIWKKHYQYQHSAKKRLKIKSTGAAKLRKSGLTLWSFWDFNQENFYMNIQSDFQELLKLLEKHGVEYMIVGGYAVALYAK